MNLFISYSSKSREIVRQLAEDLTNLGYDVWFDAELTGGQLWWQAILSQIRECDVFIFALTPESLESYPCELEWTYARDCHKRILPIQAAEVAVPMLPPELQDIQLVDYREQGKSQQAALNKAIMRLPPAQPLPDPLPPEPTTPRITVDAHKSVPTRTEIFDIPLAGRGCNAVFSPNYDRLLIGTTTGVIELWAIARQADGNFTLSMLSNVSTPIGPAQAVAISPDGRWGLAGGEKGGAVLWDLENFETEPTFFATKGSVHGATFTPDSQMALTGGDDATVKMWHVNQLNQAQSNVILRHTRPVRSIAISANGEYVISGGMDKVIRMWDYQRNSIIRQFKGHDSYVNSVAFSPDGQSIVSGSSDTSVRLWDAATGQEIRRLQGHTERVRGVAFALDGRHIFSTGWDKLTILWDAQTGEELVHFVGHSDRINSVALAPDGKYIVTASFDKTVRVWATGL